MSQRIAAAVWVKTEEEVCLLFGCAGLPCGGRGVGVRHVRLLAQMTVQEKFGQLTMAGPATPTGSDLIPLAEKGEIGSVLDLTGADNINAVQKAAVDDSPTVCWRR